MEVIKKSKMPDGTFIQIENWRKEYSHIKTLGIAVYPIATNNSNAGFIEKNEKFRLELTGFTDNEQVKNIFEQLEKGQISIKDLIKHFRDGKKDEFLLGLSDTE